VYKDKQQVSKARVNIQQLDVKDNDESISSDPSSEPEAEDRTAHK